MTVAMHADPFRSRDDSDNLIALFRVDHDDLGVCRIVIRGELSDKNPTQTLFERWDAEAETWETLGTLAPLQAHSALDAFMDL